MRRNPRSKGVLRMRPFVLMDLGVSVISKGDKFEPDIVRHIASLARRTGLSDT